MTRQKTMSEKKNNKGSGNWRELVLYTGLGTVVCVVNVAVTSLLLF